MHGNNYTYTRSQYKKMIKMDKIKKLHLNLSRMPAKVPKWQENSKRKKKRKQKLKNPLECRREKKLAKLQEAGTLFAAIKSKKTWLPGALE